MATTPRLKVTPYKNRGGSISWRLSGTVGGHRLRQNYSSELEAITERNKILESALRSPAPVPIITRLSPSQVQSAELALAALPAGTSLLEAATYFSAHFRPIARASFKAAAEDWEDWLLRERKAKGETAAYQAGVIKQFATAAGISSLGETSAELLRSWVYSPAIAVRSQRDRFDLLSYFFRWAVRHRHAHHNPMAELERPVVKNEAPPAILSFDETWQLLQEALVDAEGPDMLPYFAICLLSGVRPEEVQYLTWGDIYLDHERPFFEVNKTKGGRRRRNTEICDPLCKILSWAKAKNLSPGFVSRRKFRRIRLNAGLDEKWEADILRHTYASHAYEMHHDIDRLAKAMGNSEDVLFQHYIRPVLHDSATRFFGISLHWNAARKKSVMGTGPKPRKWL